MSRAFKAAKLGALVTSAAKGQVVAVDQQANPELITRIEGEVPLFSVTWWPGLRSAIPAGYIPADGQLLDRAVYPDAWTRLQAGDMPTVSDATWIADATKRACYTLGDGGATFRVPDLNGKQIGSRAVVLRGDGTDSAGAAGAVQGDAIRNITGSGGSFYGDKNSANPPASVPSGALGATETGNYLFQTTTSPTHAVKIINFDASRVVPTANENRMVNATGCYVIKLFGAVVNTGTLDAAALNSAKLDKTEFYGRAGDAGAFGFRNKIINGDFRISQRGTAPVLANSAYYVDRYITWSSGSAVSIAPMSNASGASSPHYFGVTGAAGNTGASVLQRIEAINVKDLSQSSFTFSCDVFSSTARSVFLEFRTTDTVDNWTTDTAMGRAQYDIPANTWNRLYIVGNSSKVANGLTCRVDFGPVVGGESCATTGWQLEAGTKRTPFEVRPYGAELYLCQRYYQEVPNVYSPNTSYATVRFLAPMRVMPTLVSVSGDQSPVPTYSIGSYAHGYQSTAATVSGTALLKVSAEL